VPVADPERHVVARDTDPAGAVAITTEVPPIATSNIVLVEPTTV
jgi:hypothetical protein